MQILINHLGYQKSESKFALVQVSTQNPSQAGFLDLYSWNSTGGTLLAEFEYSAPQAIAEWKTGLASSVDFSSIQTVGRCFFKDRTTGICSENFEIHEKFSTDFWISDILFYFKGQRCSGYFDQADRALPLFEYRPGFEKDVHGGWYDASGDMSKYFSHLSYANFFNPQQTPVVVWSLLKTFEKFSIADDINSKKLKERLLEEALHGADFLVRMQDPEGFFYQTVFDQWSKDPKRRVLCSYKTQAGTLLPQIQAAWRSGAGVAIAALAQASRLCGDQRGDFAGARYLDVAKSAFEHLLANNRKYLPDGKENLIDDYCSLLAGIELFKATKDQDYLTFCRGRAEAMTQMLGHDENSNAWWSADRDCTRPFSHAAEEGMPVIALIEYLSIETDLARHEPLLFILRDQLNAQIQLNSNIFNPFGLARQYTQNINGGKKQAFFMAHQNETGYWWQGENARLASLAFAWKKAAQLFSQDSDFAKQLNLASTRQIDWLLGLNPFDSCMWHGKGRNNIAYQEGYPNAPGGVCNGITSGFYNEEDIDFGPEDDETSQPHQRWRWREQWIPHGAWFLLACSEL